jgi:DNA replication protein DnaC
MGSLTAIEVKVKTQVRHEIEGGMRVLAERRDLPWRDDYVSLADRYLTDEDRHWLYARNPGLPVSSKTGCPTCEGAKVYIWKGYERPCDCHEQLALAKHYLMAGIGELYQRQDWEDFQGDAHAVQTVQQYVEGHRRYVRAGLGLILQGPYGTGKSLLATLAAKELVKLGYTVFFTTFGAMIEEFTKGWGDNEDMARFEAVVVRSKVLVLDDVGKEFKSMKTNLVESTFDHVLRRRVAALRPTLLTTNLSYGELAQGYGGSILSLLSEFAISCRVDGNDWRPKALGRSLDELDSGERRPIT